jgi:hypothetical protein
MHRLHPSPVYGWWPSKGAPLIMLAVATGESGGEERNINKKVKKNVHRSLSPTSVDKSVNKVSLPSNCCAFLYLQHVFAQKLSIG